MPREIDRREIPLSVQLRDERGHARFEQLRKDGFTLFEIEYKHVSVPIAIFKKFAEE